MFSIPENSHPKTAALRNPRRRQRASSGDTLPEPKRQRPETHTSHDTVSIASSGRRFNQLFETESQQELPVSIDLPYRPVEKTSSAPSDSSKPFLLNNGLYSVSRLPSVPSQIRGISKGPLRCVVASEYGLAAALTAQQVIVWPYSSRLSSSDPSSAVTLLLPEPSTKMTDPLPFGTFIPGSATADTGFVAVVPSTGKIAFWETLSRNYAAGLTKHKQNGIRGSLPGMMSSEFVTNILNAEPAGIILTLSTGRIAHVDLRDGEGKPGISTRFLETNPSSMGGFFGGLRNALVGATRRRKIAAIRAGRSIQRGQRDVVVVTSTGSVETWDIRWNNGSRLKTEVDVMPNMVEALRNVSLHIEDNRIKDSINVLDAVVCEDSGDESSPSQGTAGEVISMWLLVSVSTETTTSYFVVGLDLTEDRQTIGPIRPVNYNAPSQGIQAEWTPKLSIPKPETVAFVTFADTIALLFLHPVEENCPSQETLLNGRVTAPFQDLIRLKRSGGYSILGYGQEDASDEQRLPSCILMIQNCGLVRISFASNWMDKPFDSSTTVKSRLEQIVFFEDLVNNPIDFHEYQELHGSVSSLEEAALEISDEIVDSTSDYISNTIPSIEKQMEQRAVALSSLATYLSRQTASISYPGRWNLLWNAEKLAAHQSIWKVHESTKRASPDKQTFLEEILKSMSETLTTKANGEVGKSELDRHWFINETLSVEHIIPWILGGARNSYNDTAPITPHFVDQIWQASEISLALLSGALQFRQENAKKYRLLNGENSLDGHSQPSYELLPEFWTSTTSIYGETEKLLDAELNTCIKQMRHGVGKGDGPGSVQAKVEKIKQNVPKEFELLVRIYKERTQWCAAQSDADTQREGHALEKTHIERRKSQLYKMAAIGLLEEAIHLAEKYRDMVALVELMVELQDQVKQKETQPQSPGGVTAEGIKNELSHWRKRIDNYFDKYGEEWAEAFFTRQLHFGQPVMLLVMKEYREYATRFLRKRQGYNNLSWMNEVLAERDYQRASELLAGLAISPDTDLWAKRVKLSMAKLSTLAACEADASANPAYVQDVADFDDQSEIAVVQEMLYDHIHPFLHDAIDEGAEIQLANDQFAKEFVSSKPALRESLQRGIAKLVIGRPMESNELIDLLTLMDPVAAPDNDARDILGHEFMLALRVLKLDGTIREQHKYREALENIIWRRCMIRDDWSVLNTLSSKSDEEIEEELSETYLYRTIQYYMDDLVDDSNSTHLCSPSDILNAPVLPPELVSRMLPERRAQLLDDLNAENKILHSYVEKGKLDHWFTWIVDKLKSSNAQEEES